MKNPQRGLYCVPQMRESGLFQRLHTVSDEVFGSLFKISMTSIPGELLVTAVTVVNDFFFSSENEFPLGFSFSCAEIITFVLVSAF